MAIARLSTGEVFAHYSDINEITKPLQVGKFSLPASARQKIAGLQKPLTSQGAECILDVLDPNADSIMQREGFEFQYRRVGCYVPPETRGGQCSFTTLEEGSVDVNVETMSEDELAAYLMPHNVHAHDWHFTFSGTIIKGIQLDDDLQAVVYVTPGEWIRLSPAVLNWPIFAFGTPVIGLSYFDRMPGADGEFDMSLHPDHSVIDSMKF